MFALVLSVDIPLMIHLQPTLFSPQLDISQPQILKIFMLIKIKDLEIITAENNS